MVIAANGRCCSLQALVTGENSMLGMRRFRELEKHGVGFRRTQWLGDGDAMCKLQVTRLAKRK